ncbi:MAG: RHS repeat-associated core domain-containing protein [Burkholderiaceae bacterium]
MFQGEPQASQTLPNQQTVGQGFIDWLKSNFGWMFQQPGHHEHWARRLCTQTDSCPAGPSWVSMTTAQLPATGKSEYIWLPTGDGAIPVGLFRNGRFFAIHTDHLGTPRLMANDVNKPVWQWPYSAFGATKPTGILKATVKPKNAMTSKPVMLKSTTPAQDLVLRYPGQMNDVETGTLQNNWRSYWAMHGRYTQADPLGLDGGLNLFGYVAGNPLSAIDPFGLAGHHYVPRAVWTNEDLSAETRAVFNRATTGPIPGGHNYGDGHRAYNDAVKEMWEKYKKTNPCEKMTPADAQRFVDMVRSSQDPRIKQFLHRIYMKIVNGALRRAPGAKSE